MSEPDRLDLDAIKQRARVRRRWPTGKIGNPRAWCRYCGALIPGERAADRYATPHTERCPVPEAEGRVDDDLDALVAEVERLRGRLGG